jgi:hypothetical protein
LMDAGYGADPTPDLIGVTLSGAVPSMDGITRSIVRTVQRTVPQTVFVITSTGSTRHGAGAVDANADLVPAVESAIPVPRSVVASPASEGVYLDPATATAAGISTQSVVDAMKTQTSAVGSPLFADAFPSFAVQFGRYCS